MKKKFDFSKHVFALKRFLKDKSGQILDQYGRPIRRERTEEERRAPEEAERRRTAEDEATMRQQQAEIDRLGSELAEINRQLEDERRRGYAHLPEDLQLWPKEELERFIGVEEDLIRKAEEKRAAIRRIQSIAATKGARKAEKAYRGVTTLEGLGRGAKEKWEGTKKSVKEKWKPWKWNIHPSHIRGRMEDVGGDIKDFFKGKWAWRGGKEDWGGWMFILMTGLLYYLDMFLGYNGINVDKFLNNIAFIGVESYIGWFFNAIVLTLLIAYWAIYQPKIPEFLSFVLVAETVSLILFLGGMGIMLIHLAFICAFYFLYIRSTAENEVAANIITFFLLAFDFFGYGILATVLNNPIVSNRLIIPMWFYFALIYTREKERSFWIDLIIFMVIMGNVFYFVGGIDGLRNMGKPLTTEEIREQRNFFATAINNVRQTFYKAYEGFRQDMEAQLEYATGGYYKGRVEKTKKEPLGVYIEELKTSEPTFYSGEKAIIWGTLKARGLEDAVIIKIICNRAKKFVQQTLGSLEEVGPEANEIIPDRPFMIYQQEYRDFECSFSTTPDATNLDEGINTIKAGAEFGFSTLAYLRAYFMDRDRLIAMRREGLDVLKEFDVKDKEIVAVYTTGPVSIGMETTDPLIGVSKAGTGLDYTRLGVTLENVEGWEGKIKKVNELVFLIPKGLSINNPAGDCTRQFKIYGLKGEGQDVCFNSKYANDPLNAYKEGSGSCERFALKPCIETCALNKIKKEDWEKIKDNADGKKQKINELAEGCMTQCQPNYESCVEDCYVLFEFDIDKEEKNEKPEYTAYALDLDKIETGEYENIGRFRSFSCRINVDDKVLGTTPLTLRYFRAKARYDYVIEKEVDINLEPRGLPWYVPGGERYEKEKPSGPSTREFEGERPTRIATYANEIGVPEEYALALAYKESGLRHCCEEVGKNNDREGCTPTTDSRCGPEFILESYDGSSFGIMQLNKQHCAWFYPQICDGGSIPSDCDSDNAIKNKPLDCDVYKKANCKSGESAYDIGCNIKIGLRYLKYLYDKFKDGCRGFKEYEKACEECFYCELYAYAVQEDVGRVTTQPLGCEGVEKPAYYYSYTNWNAALRAYNGWACGKLDQRSYVHNVIKVMDKIASGEIDLKGPAIEERPEKPYPPKSVSAQPIGSSSGIYIKWEPSESTDIIKYGIWRTSEEEVEPKIIETVPPNKFEYNDWTSQGGVTYIYCVKAINMNKEESDCSDESKSNPVKANIGPPYIEEIPGAST